MKARYPDCGGIVVRDGTGIRDERYGHLLIKQFADGFRR